MNKIFKVGDRVKCINIDKLDGLYNSNEKELVLGKVYKIINVKCEDPYYLFIRQDKNQFVFLEGQETGFYSSRFIKYNGELVKKFLKVIDNE